MIEGESTENGASREGQTDRADLFLNPLARRGASAPGLSPWT
jgi:hypothetical protein